MSSLHRVLGGYLVRGLVWSSSVATARALTVDAVYGSTPTVDGVVSPEAGGVE